MFEPTATVFEDHAPGQAADLIRLAKLYKNGTAFFRVTAAGIARQLLEGTEGWAAWCQLAQHQDD